jgi:catechol-2,3-dioxygenase
MLWDGYHHHFAFYTWESAGAVQRNPDMSGLHSIALETSQKASFEDPGEIKSFQPKHEINIDPEHPPAGYPLANGDVISVRKIDRHSA